ncbi:hypothetical protein Hanom_Chr17g01542181 [Helianthus anomalus]
MVLATSVGKPHNYHQSWLRERSEAERESNIAGGYESAAERRRGEGSVFKEVEGECDSDGGEKRRTNDIGWCYARTSHGVMVVGSGRRIWLKRLLLALEDTVLFVGEGDDRSLPETVTIWRQSWSAYCKIEKFPWVKCLESSNWDIGEDIGHFTLF